MVSNLKRIRESKGFTQKELAEKSGINIRQIQHYEQGSLNINHAWIETALKIADALEVDVRDILE